MEILIEKQLISVAYSLILGLIFGAAYDIIRMIHIICGIASYSGREKSAKKGIIPFSLFFIFDLVYAVFIGVAFSVFVYFANYGDFRWFLMAGTVVGFAAYHLTLGRVVMYFSEAVVRFLKLIFRYTVIIPLGFVFRVGKKIIVLLYRITLGKLVDLLTERYYMWRNKRYARMLSRDIRFTEKQ